MTKDKRDRYKESQDKLKKTQIRTINRIEDLGNNSILVFNALNDIQDIIDKIRGIPDKNRLQLQDLIRLRNEWKQQVSDITQEATRAAQNTKPGLNEIEYGAAVGTIAPNLAAGLATSFETFTLAFLAPVLGGPTVAGIALAMAITPIFDPATAIAAGIIWKVKSDEKQQVEKIFTLINERNSKSFNLALIELNERIKLLSTEVEKLNIVKNKISELGTDYSTMSEEQKYELGAALNTMLSSTRLLTNPIMGLKPAFTEMDYYDYLTFFNYYMEVQRKQFIECTNDKHSLFNPTSEKDYLELAYNLSIKRKEFYIKHKRMIIDLCNLLHSIKLSEKDKNLLCKCLSHNEEFINTYQIQANEINQYLIDDIIQILATKDIN